MSNHHKPNFFVIGAEKAGTTTLCELLQEHPDVFMCRPKEPNFFTKTDALHRLSSYERMFRAAAHRSAIGEGSTTYSKCLTHPGTADRIADYAPEARIIYLVRDPMERMRSQWMQRLDMALPTPPCLNDAVRTLPVFLDASSYWRNLSVYRHRFPDEQILVLFLDDLQSNAEHTMQRCFDFLQLPPHVAFTEPDRPRNPASSKRRDRMILNALRRLPGYERLRDSISPAGLRRALKPLLTRPIVRRPDFDEPTRQWLSEQLADDIRQFLQFHDKPPDHWHAATRTESLIGRSCSDSAGRPTQRVISARCVSDSR